MPRVADHLPHLATPTDAHRLARQHKDRADIEAQLRDAQRKVRSLERAIARLLTNVDLPEATRETLVGLLAGSRYQETGGIAAAALTPKEQQLVERYREMAQPHKSVLTIVAMALCRPVKAR